MLRIIKKLFAWLIPKCPDCGEKMYTEFLDMKWDNLVYKCDKCNKRWM